MILKASPGAKVLEFAGSILWVDEEGFLNSVAKSDAAQVLSNDEIKREMDRLREFLGNKKMCILAESNSKAVPPPKDQRDFIAAEINSITRAMAIITNSPLSRMVSNLFFSFKPPAYPFKMFTNEADARAWLRQYA